MKLKKLKHVSNSNRHTLKINKSLLTKNSKIVKTLIIKNKRNHGRSSLNGRITVWHKGNGVKRLYRDIQTTKKIESKNSLVLANCFDPNRNAFVNLNFGIKKKNFFFELAAENIYPGSLLKKSKKHKDLKLGDRCALGNFPSGTLIHNLTLNSGLKAKYIRSAGTFGQIIEAGSEKIKLKLPSKSVINVSAKNEATLGIVSNAQHNLTIIGKAGTNRNLGKRPTTRGNAMNPVDHPHGGRGNKGIIPRSPWGKLTKSGSYIGKKRFSKNNEN